MVVTREREKKKKKKKKKEKKGRGGKRRKKKNLFTTISSPFILATSTLASALRHRFSDALHLFIGTRAGLLFLSLSLSLSFFRVLPPLFTTLIVLRVWLQTSRALSLAKNAISAMTFHQGTNIVRSTYLFHYWLERYLSFFPFVISMLAKCINSNFLHLHNLLDSITKVIMNGWTCKRNVIRRQLLLRFDVAK